MPACRRQAKPSRVGAGPAPQTGQGACGQPSPSPGAARPWWGIASRAQSPPPTPPVRARKPGISSPTPVPARLTAERPSGGGSFPFVFLAAFALLGAQRSVRERACHPSTIQGGRDGLAWGDCGCWCSPCVFVRPPRLAIAAGGLLRLVISVEAVVVGYAV